LTRALAPVIGGPIFAWSLTEGHKYPFNYWFAFLLQSLLLLILMSFTLGLDNRLNYPKGMLSILNEVVGISCNFVRWIESVWSRVNA
jgi:hypothetical protein